MRSWLVILRKVERIGKTSVVAVRSPPAAASGEQHVRSRPDLIQTTSTRRYRAWTLLGEYPMQQPAIYERGPHLASPQAQGTPSSVRNERIGRPSAI